MFIQDRKLTNDEMQTINSKVLDIGDSLAACYNAKENHIELNRDLLNAIEQLNEIGQRLLQTQLTKEDDGR